jgi:general secretion pathway protein A
MYLSYYGLSREPFHITPDPEFLYLSRSHREALACIIYGIEQKKGFVAITGAIGVGKTTILRSYLDSTKKDFLKIVYVFNSKLTFEELLRTICKELGLVAETSVVTEMVNKLYEALIDEYKKGNTVVLVVDEAQNMPVETLENLRMISNLETSTDKLIQIVLVGQPEFDDIISTNRLRQLKQRMAVRSTILPFTMAESLDYMKYRLTKAGGDPSLVFTERAFKKIAKNSHGIPRTINIWCDNALISGFGREQKPVGTSTVRNIISDFSDHPHRNSVRKPAFATILCFLVLVMAAGAFAVFYPSKWHDLMNWTATLAKSKQQIQDSKSIGSNVRPSESVKENHQVLSLEQKLNQYPAPISLDDHVMTSKAVTRTVVEGDTLLGLVRDVYKLGQNDPQAARLLELVKVKNSQIIDKNKILTGQTIVFPDFKKTSVKTKRDSVDAE